MPGLMVNAGPDLVKCDSSQTLQLQGLYKGIILNFIGPQQVD